MRFTLLLTFVLSSATAVWAQAPTSSERPLTATSASPNTVEQRIERIQIEDGGARIDELRVGGETKSITVQPKGGMPGYDVQPVTGARSWKILGF
jgi:hypothetical protein